MTKTQREELVKIMIKYKKAFSLRDEIGTCPKIEVELELNDKRPFFIRPYSCSEADKDVIDKQMKKGCLLGFLKKGMTSYSSPIMLIPRKQGGIPRLVTDFRHLNSRLVVLQPSIPLVRDAIQIIGASGCEVISLIDLRDAYHTLPLSSTSKKYCGITPYYGSSTYIYQRLGMGLSVSPAIWQNFIQTVLEEIPNYRKHYLAIMDDIMIHSKHNDHMSLVVKLFKALIRNGLKISPKKCQLFKRKLVYMGHTMVIEDGLPKLKPLKTRIEAILKLKPPQTIKDCRSFCGMVNYLSIYLKDLQLKLIPIYHLTRKGIPFEWGEKQDKAFEDIKKALTNPPVLVMPDSHGHIILVSDTSKIGCGGALYQEIRHVYRLVSYCSKKLPEAVQRYSISELELTGLLANISIFKHILKNVKFTVFCDHSALVFIINAKKELPTLRLKKLIENLTAYCFVIRLLKGKEMHISDFLSRHPIEDGESPHEIIPIAFQLIERIMKIEENEQGELCWATDYEQDVLYINSLKDENVIDLFMAVFEEVDKGDLEVHNLCNSGSIPVVNPIRKSSLLRKSEDCVSKVIDNHNQCLGKASKSNQPVLIKGNKTDSVANPIRKSDRFPTLAGVINEHEDCLSKSAHGAGKAQIPFKEIQDQCFIATTRSRSKEASEKVPDIFPLQGEHRKPEYTHKPKRIVPPKDDVPPMGQLPSQIPQDTQIPQDIDVRQSNDGEQVPKIQKAERMKGKAFLSPTLFQTPKLTPFGIADNLG